MAQQETRKQQIARRLRVSERVLEQYLQLKRAEVEIGSANRAPDSSALLAPQVGRTSEPRKLHEKRI